MLVSENSLGVFIEFRLADEKKWLIGVTFFDASAIKPGVIASKF